MLVDDRLKEQSGIICDSYVAKECVDRDTVLFIEL